MHLEVPLLMLAVCVALVLRPWRNGPAMSLRILAPMARHLVRYALFEKTRLT